MASSTSPKPQNVPAIKLGTRLRKLREDAKFPTQAALGTRLNVSNDYVSKVETGKMVPAKDVLLAWLDACRATDEARDYLTELWGLACDARGGIADFILRWFENEARADFLRLWALLFMPGQLQTREYALAMFLKGGMDEDEAAEQADIRMRRQAILFDRPDPVHVTAVIHEHALHNRVGTPEVMIGQLERLLELSRRPNIVIQVVRDDGYFIGMEGAFEIASGDEIPDTLLMLAYEDQMHEDRTLTRKAIAQFEEIRGYALSAEDSRALIREAIERWKGQQQ
jgi:transcriptional regulator with XRE-family HTH domain